MKQLTNAIVTFLALCTAFACKKEPETMYEEVKDGNTGQVTALLNGQPWQSDVVLSESTNDSDQRIYIGANVYVNGVYRQGLQIDGIGLHNDKQVVYDPLKWISLGKGVYRKGKDTCFAIFHLSDGDVGENGYGILEDEDNFIQLEEYNGSSPIRGSFQFSMYRFKPEASPQTQGLPDTLRFTNGKFNVLLKE